MVTKTELMIIRLRQKLQSLNGYTININVDGVQVNQITPSKSLKRVKPFVSTHTAIKISKGFIELHFDYCT